MYIDILDAGHGDCLLVTCGKILILIDAGPKSFKIRKNVTQRLKTLLNGRYIDIAIVTHNDDDHIGGYKYFLDSGVNIKMFIFNSLSFISEVFKKNDKKISFRQDNELNEIINNLGIKIQTFQQEDSPLIFDEIIFTALTPNNKILEKLDNKAKTESHHKKIAKCNFIESSIKECILDIKEGKDNFIEDKSITNKSSISFILEFMEKRILFLGDSHPTDVIYSLKTVSNVEKKFNLVKLSHHASEKNTNTELLELIGKAEYIICADKSHHGHPNNKTIGRIINFNENAKIHMSSRNEVLSKVFEECILQGYPISVTYPDNGVNRVVL